MLNIFYGIMGGRHVIRIVNLSENSVALQSCIENSNHILQAYKVTPSILVEAIEVFQVVLSLPH